MFRLNEFCSGGVMVFGEWELRLKQGMMQRGAGTREEEVIPGEEGRVVCVDCLGLCGKLARFAEGLVPA